MRRFGIRRAFFVALILLISIPSFGGEWKSVDRFDTGDGIYVLKTFETGTDGTCTVTRRVNRLIVVRGKEGLSVDVSGLSAVVSRTFNDVDTYRGYLENHPQTDFDDRTMAVEENLDPKSFDKKCSLPELVDSLNDGFKIFESDSFGYKFYKKSYDEELGCTVEMTYLLELLVMNLSDYIDGSAKPPAEDIRWTRVSDFRPEAGTYDIRMSTSGIDSETGISADSDMFGRLIIRGVNSYSRVTIEILSGTMVMYFTPESYGEAKSLYRMAYGDAYRYDDERHTISGDIDGDTLSQFSSAMTYKDFLATGGSQIYSDEKGSYKILSKSDNGAAGSMNYDLTMVFEKSSR